MKKLFITLLLMTLNAKAEVLEGVAKLKNGEFAYREIHKVDRDPEGETQRIETSYFRKDDSQFASISSDFKKNKYVPDSVFIDQRFDEKIVMSVVGTRIEFKFFKKDLLTKTKNLKLDEKMVAGQGFDNFLQDKIMHAAAKSKTVHFIVIPKADYFKFKINDKSSSENSEKRITIEPESFFVRMIIDEIRISYSDSGKILKRFQGISVLNSDQNESQVVDIEYKVVQGD